MACTSLEKRGVFLVCQAVSGQFWFLRTIVGVSYRVKKREKAIIDTDIEARVLG